MKTLTIEISDEAHNVADRLVAAGGKASLSSVVSNYLAGLGGDGYSDEELSRLLEIGLDSGDPVEMTEEAWDELWREADGRTVSRMAR